MRRILITLFLLIAAVGLQAQRISHIETTRSWYYVYDDAGKKVYTFSTSQGELVAYSDSPTLLTLKVCSFFPLTS